MSSGAARATRRVALSARRSCIGIKQAGIQIQHSLGCGENWAPASAGATVLKWGRFANAAVMVLPRRNQRVEGLGPSGVSQLSWDDGVSDSLGPPRRK